MARLRRGHTRRAAEGGSDLTELRPGLGEGLCRVRVCVPWQCSTGVASSTYFTHARLTRMGADIATTGQAYNHRSEGWCRKNRHPPSSSSRFACSSSARRQSAAIRAAIKVMNPTANNTGQGTNFVVFMGRSPFVCPRRKTLGREERIA